LRERLGGEWWWILNMEALGEGGVLVSLLGLMRWVYGRILGGAESGSIITPDLKWEMAPRLDFGMIFGVGI
jgi:hypothetical protein